MPLDESKRLILATWTENFPDLKAAATSLNGDSQYPWSNVSRDGSWYAVEQQTSQTPSHPGTLTLFFGSLSGGTSNRFA